MSDTLNTHAADPHLARNPRVATGKPITYLGPAVVLACDRTITVELPATATRPDQTASTERHRVAVTPAFTFPYQPAVDDTLLVMGQQDQFFAIGVIAGSRPHALQFPGNASVRTVNGKLTLASDQAVEVRAPKITIRTGVLRTIAERCVEKSNDLRRWVRGLFTLRAGTSRRLVDGLDSTRCENSSTLAKDSVTIDGDHLNLGH